MRTRHVVAFAAALSCFARSASAEEPHELRHDVSIDVAVTFTAIALTLGSEIGKGDIGPALSCRWCARDGEGHDTLNALDRGTRDALVWGSPTTAAHIADAMGFLAAPASAFGTLILAGQNDHAGDKSAVDSLLVAEAVSLSALMNQVAKFTAGRERPFVHVLAPEEKSKTSHPTDNNLSFYSGHTGLTMTLAASAGTIAMLRGYRLAPLVWSSGVAISLVTGYLRIAADKHYLSDVLTGAVVGATVGTLVPLLFHGRRPEETHVAIPGTSGAASLPLPSAATLGGAF